MALTIISNNPETLKEKIVKAIQMGFTWGVRVSFDKSRFFTWFLFKDKKQAYYFYELLNQNTCIKFDPQPLNQVLEHAVEYSSFLECDRVRLITLALTYNDEMTFRARQRYLRTPQIIWALINN